MDSLPLNFCLKKVNIIFLEEGRIFFFWSVTVKEKLIGPVVIEIFIHLQINRRSITLNKDSTYLMKNFSTAVSVRGTIRIVMGR